MPCQNVARLTLFGLVASSTFIVIVSACLPDLAPPSPPTVFIEPPEASGCGDGIIATLDDGGDAGEACDPGAGSVLGCSQQCTISCGGAIGPSGHCYFLADQGDFNSARKNCTNANAHVVTIGSVEEAELVRARVADGSVFRIALSDDNMAWSTGLNVEEPGWPLVGNTCRGCFAQGADPDSGTFASLEPDAGHDQHCLVAKGGQWLQVSCANPNALTICEREPAGRRSQSCGGPLCTTLATTSGKKRYVISAVPASAAIAALSCEQFGGSLVLLDSPAEREDLAREIRKIVSSPGERETETVWIGLSKVGDVWRWDDNVARDPQWADGEPRTSASGRAFLKLDVGFDSTLVATNDEDAGMTPRLFVCQRPIE